METGHIEGDYQVPTPLPEEIDPLDALVDWIGSRDDS